MAGLVCDANVVIALFDANNVHHSEAIEIYLQSTGTPIYLSALTYAEILTQPAAQGKLDFFVKNLETGGFEVAEISKELAIEMSQVRAATGLKMPDVCVLALANYLGAELVTADQKLADRSKKYKVKTRTLG
jgi:predicted nucleic acid-binding protein